MGAAPAGTMMGVEMQRPRFQVSKLVIAEHALVSRRALKYVVVLTIVAVVMSGFAVRLLDPSEFDSLWEGMWWAASTVTTVGYGDLVPSTPLGRLVAVPLMFLGIGLVSILTAAVASALLSEEVGDEERHIDRELATIAATLERIERRLAALEARADDPAPAPR